MEPNTNTSQIAPQVNTVTTTATKKNSNILMILILLILFVIFGVLIYAIRSNNEADYLSAINSTNYLNQVKSVVPTPSNQGEVEGAYYIDVGDIDTELGELNSDLQGL